MEYLLANLYARTSSVCFIALMLAGKGLRKQSGGSYPFFLFLNFYLEIISNLQKVAGKKNQQTVHITSFTLYPDSHIVKS